MPLFLYISGREAWQSSCQMRAFYVRLRTQLSSARSSSCSCAACRLIESSSCTLLLNACDQNATALFIAKTFVPPKSRDHLRIFSRPQVLRLRYELMCLKNGKNNDGGIHPLDISVPLSCASASHSHSAVPFFFLLRAGPPAPAPAMPKIPRLPPRPRCPRYH